MIDGYKPTFLKLIEAISLGGSDAAIVSAYIGLIIGLWWAPPAWGFLFTLLGLVYTVGVVAFSEMFDDAFFDDLKCEAYCWLVENYDPDLFTASLEALRDHLKDYVFTLTLHSDALTNEIGQRIFQLWSNYGITGADMFSWYRASTVQAASCVACGCEPVIARFRSVDNTNMNGWAVAYQISADALQLDIQVTRTGAPTTIGPRVQINLSYPTADEIWYFNIRLTSGVPWLNHSSQRLTPCPAARTVDNIYYWPFRTYDEGNTLITTIPGITENGPNDFSLSYAAMVYTGKYTQLVDVFYPNGTPDIWAGCGPDNVYPTGFVIAWTLNLETHTP